MSSKREGSLARLSTAVTSRILSGAPSSPASTPALILRLSCSLANSTTALVAETASS